MNTYTAAVCFTADLVGGEVCDVAVHEDDHPTGDGKPVMSDREAMPPQETTVRVDDPDRTRQALVQAADILAANGWQIDGEWFDTGDVAYAPVSIDREQAARDEQALEDLARRGRGK